MSRMFAAVAVLIAAAPAVAQVCYRLPFSNPNLADGWGSTCCGRTNPHRGVDFPQASGTAIPAVADGVVVLKTFNGCLGNVIVVRHADGMFSGYNHLNAQSTLAIGAAVTIGQTVGRVGSTGTCTTGPHLHLSMAPTVGGYASGTTVNPYTFIQARLTCNTATRGALDAATCEGISGWAQDQNVPTSAIAAHVYIGGSAGQAAAHGYALKADLNRADLCTAIGSCSHGFSMPVPLSYFDGVSRPVFAYAIDSAGGPNTGLGQKTLKCDAAQLPRVAEGSVRRLITSLAALTAWKLPLDEIGTVTEEALAAIPLGPNLEDVPTLVKFGNEAAVYVKEYGSIRHIGNPGIFSAWRFGAFATAPVTDEPRYLVGADWAPWPHLLKASGDKVYLIDSPPPLWAELKSDNVPATMTAGAVAEVTLHLLNKGCLKWDASIEVLSTPRGVDSALCDPSWTSCTQASTLTATHPGEEGLATFKIKVPSKLGPSTACFGLAKGSVWFSDVGQNGPADEAICKTIQVIAGAPTKPNPGTGGGAGSITSVKTGCAQGGSSLAGLMGLIGLLAFVRRRR